MKRTRSALFSSLYLINLLLLAFLVGYQVYLLLVDPDYESVHVEQIDRIQSGIGESADFRFAVVGNIENSIPVFRDQVIPKIHEGDYDFLISAGNAVSGGHAESYRTIHKILSRLTIPYLLTFGENEQSDFGSFRFYQQFGPHFFSFTAADAHFIFLDGTGKSSYSWQLDWLERELANSPSQHQFVFIGIPVHEQLEATPAFESDHYLDDPAFKEGLTQLFERYRVDVVFSANLTLYSDLQHNGVNYVTTGGAGGLVVGDDNSFHHYVGVTVKEGGDILYEPVPMNIHLSPVRRTLDSALGAVYSFFYVSYLRFFLGISALMILAAFLHRRLFREREYYPDFDVDPTPYQGRSLRIGMYSNNYFPFVSGVTVSVERLRRGLQSLGDRVLLLVPQYRDSWEDDEETVRASTLLAFGSKGEFRLSNPFLARLRRRVRAFRPDIIHVHHPFWLGSVGLFMGRVMNIPVIYTYHTRLEHYAHFVPLPGLLFRNLISHYLIRRFSNKCQGVVVPTYSAEEYLRVIGVTTNTLVQPTGIDVERYQQTDPDRLTVLRKKYGIDPDDRVLISVSRISKEKNIEFMLESLDRLRRKGVTGFRLLLIGDGPGHASVQACIETLGLEDKVTMLGAVAPEQMVDYYHLGDLFVFASKSETQGMVILEAMSAGMPVVAVRSSGIDDVIQEGVNGYKTPENRSVWASRVEELIADPALRAEMGRRAEAFAADYDVSVYAQRVHDFYAFVLAQYHSGRPWLR